MKRRGQKHSRSMVKTHAEIMNTLVPTLASNIEPNVGEVH